uniref:Uncharacterized protein n=1 Tax=Globodera pallida TaxID=36090 RepID=A0A183BIA4_GLOPA
MGQLALEATSTTDSNRDRRGGEFVRTRSPHNLVPSSSTSIPPLININSSTGRSRHSNISSGNNSNASQQMPKLPRLGSSLFDSLRNQHLTNSERQQRLRERLLQANTEHYELELARQGRLAILKACEARPALIEGENESKYSKVVEKVRAELEEVQGRISELGDLRNKVERALRQGEQTLQQMEDRMRVLAKDQQQLQIVDLVHALARQRAERAAIYSDFALQGKRLRRQEGQLERIKRYERVADRLIEGNEYLDEEDRVALHREYRLLRSQLDKMLPVENGLPSWNAQILAGTNVKLSNNDTQKRRQSYGVSFSNEDLGKTFTVVRPKVLQRRDAPEEKTTILPKLKLAGEVKTPDELGRRGRGEGTHLGDNAIEEIEKGSLDPLTSLERLRLFRNKIRSLPEGVFAHSKRLRRL